MLVEGHVRVPDSRLEVYLGRLEGIVGGQDEEELEFAALRKAMSVQNRELKQGRGKEEKCTYGVGGPFRAVHSDVPVVDIGFIDEADLDAFRRTIRNLCQLLEKYQNMPFTFL